MNYSWEYAIAADKKAKNKLSNMIFTYQSMPQHAIGDMEFHEDFNAYTEISSRTLNEIALTDEVLINPYYRYREIFEGLLKSTEAEINDEVKSIVFNTAFHLLAYVDRKVGMTKTEYLLQSIIQDIKDGAYGSLNAEIFTHDLTTEQQHVVAKSIHTLCQIGEELHVFTNLVSIFFPDAYIFASFDNKCEIVCYLRKQQEQMSKRIIGFILAIFLPLGYTSRIYWDKSFGIIESGNMMNIGHIIIY